MRLLFLLIFLISFTLFSQNENQSKRFDSIFFNVAINISSSDPVKAIYLADSLSLYSTNKRQKMKSLMLIADILAKQEKRGEAIIKGLEVLEVAKKAKDYVYQARVYGFLSTQYRLIGFVDKGKSFLKKGIEVSNKISNKKYVVDYLAMANQELAEFAIEEKEYKKALEYLKLALLTYNKKEESQTKSFLIANAEEMLGRCHMFLGDKKEALSHFYKSNIFINKSGSGNTIWASLIYHRLGNAFLESKKLDSAGVYLSKSLAISKNSSHGSLKESVYKSLAEYYKQLKEIDSFSLYDTKHNKMVEENKRQKRLMINRAYNAIDKDSNTMLSNIKIYIIIGVVLFFLLLISFLKIKTPFAKSKVIPLIKKVKPLKLMISKKIKKRLIVRLKEFEESKKFLDKNMSVTKLVGLLNTNTKYFRIFLKEHKNRDYNHYINELRINYIVDKLTTDKDYLNYKISYLADECGFSSHSKFSACFKSIVGIPPSEFIKNISNKSV
ncbi:AraC family transcriptional regulator [Polaribacter sargassicola]|uniref:AraC family transcriptional regulator n=1 Tax=Polaribacter sargassicola TaxID=2836891 RepID=UPI001F013186|nr:AraC family transcriptional regulator [Polaribacter sp. DS7-9]MCG1034832.1 helix-turn-helix domain-containing protein [Polaribacter sp. DS7-9]